MSPLDKIRHDLADHIYNVLDATFPRYENHSQPNLAWDLGDALLAGIVRWSLMCSRGNNSKAAIRSGINRNTIFRIRQLIKYMEEELKYAKVEEAGLVGLNKPYKPGQKIATNRTL